MIYDLNVYLIAFKYVLDTIISKHFGRNLNYHPSSNQTFWRQYTFFVFGWQCWLGLHKQFCMQFIYTILIIWMKWVHLWLLIPQKFVLCAISGGVDNFIAWHQLYPDRRIMHWLHQIITWFNYLSLKKRICNLKDGVQLINSLVTDSKGQNFRCGWFIVIFFIQLWLFWSVLSYNCELYTQLYVEHISSAIKMIFALLRFHF